VQSFKALAEKEVVQYSPSGTHSEINRVVDSDYQDVEFSFEEVLRFLRVFANIALSSFASSESLIQRSYSK
jgi:hypothetical protein